MSREWVKLVAFGLIGVGFDLLAWFWATHPSWIHGWLQGVALAMIIPGVLIFGLQTAFAVIASPLFLMIWIADLLGEGPMRGPLE